MDGSLRFDLQSPNAPAAYCLYGGAFDRTPDEGGLLFWSAWLDGGRSLHDADSFFLSSPEFTALHGTNTSDAQFIDKLYLNVLDWPGEEGGEAFWTDNLADAVGDRADVLMHFTQLPEFASRTEQDVADGYWVV